MPSFLSVTWHSGSLFPACRRLRRAVFVREQGFSANGEFDALDRTAVHPVVWLRGRPVATGRLFRAEGGFHLGRVCVTKAGRGTGIGRFLMAAAEDRVRALGGDRLVLSAQVQAIPFYEKCGYTAYGDIYPDEGCPHRDMEKRL